MKLKMESIQKKIKDIIPIIIVYGPGSLLLFNGLLNYQAAAGFNDKALSSVGIIIKTVAMQKYLTGGYSVFTETYYASTIQFKTKEGKTTKFKEYNICAREPTQLM